MYRHACLVSFRNARCVLFFHFFFYKHVYGWRCEIQQKQVDIRYGKKERNIINVYLILWRSICFTSIEGKCGTPRFRYCRFDPQMIQNVSFLWIEMVQFDPSNTFHFTKFTNEILLLLNSRIVVKNFHIRQRLKGATWKRSRISTPFRFIIFQLKFESMN